MSQLWRIALLGLMVSVAFGAETPDMDASSAQPADVQAVWKTQKITFYFQSFTTFYTCSSLATKVKRLLIAVGAQREMKVRVHGCAFTNDIARTPSVDILLSSPVEATPEALAELAQTRSHRELVARVRGDSKQVEQQEAQFAAQWQQVSLSRGKLGLDPGDCELIEQLKKHVFPKLAIKTVEDGVDCFPGQISFTQPRLVVDALTALPTPEELAEQEKRRKKP